MDTREFELVFRSDIVWPWGLFFSEIAEFLSGELSNLRKITIKLILGEFSTVSAVAEGNADMGFVTPPACATMAFRGVGPYSKKMQNLRAIGSLPHDDRMMWAVPAESGISTIEDMKDKPLRLVIPSREFPVRFAVEKILESYGMSLEELKSAGWQILEESHCLGIPIPVMQGKADALIHEGRKTPAWFQLTKSRLMKFISIDESVLQKMVDEYGFRKATLSKGMFPGIEADVACLDWSDWLLFVRDDMPDDLVYHITSLFIERKEELFEFHFRGIPEEESNLVCPIDPKQVWRNIGEIPLHPAAERYYKEHGYI